MTLSILAKNAGQLNIQDRAYFQTALESHIGAADRCYKWLETATDTEERRQVYEQLVSALGEIERWQARLEACNA